MWPWDRHEERHGNDYSLPRRHTPIPQSTRPVPVCAPQSTGDGVRSIGRSACRVRTRRHVGRTGKRRDRTRTHPRQQVGCVDRSWPHSGQSFVVWRSEMAPQVSRIFPKDDCPDSVHAGQMGSLSLPIGEGRAESGEACPGPDPGSGPLHVAIDVKRQADTAPDTAGISEKGRL